MPKKKSTPPAKRRVYPKPEIDTFGRTQKEARIERKLARRKRNYEMAAKLHAAEAIKEAKAKRDPAASGFRPNGGDKPMELSLRDRKRVMHLSGLGLPLEQIAIAVGPPGGITVPTLLGLCRYELDTGAKEANEKVAMAIKRKAERGDTAMGIWWSKARMRWKGDSIEHTGPNGGPIQITNMNLKGLTDEELETMQTLLAKAKPDEPPK